MMVGLCGSEHNMKKDLDELVGLVENREISQDYKIGPFSLSL